MEHEQVGPVAEGRSVDVEVPLEPREPAIVRVLGGITIVITVLGAAYSGHGFYMAEGSPQQAAAAALACACAVVPYVVMRSVRTIVSRR